MEATGSSTIAAGNTNVAAPQAGEEPEARKVKPWSTPTLQILKSSLSESGTSTQFDSAEGFS